MDKTLSEQISELLLFNFKQPLIIIGNTNSISPELNNCLHNYHTCFFNKLEDKVENLHFFSPELQGKKFVILENLDLVDSYKQLALVNRVKKHKDFQIIITCQDINPINYIIINNAVQIAYNNENYIEKEKAPVISIFKRKN